jgi:hypothetical protein
VFFARGDVALPFTLKGYLKAKEELRKLKYFKNPQIKIDLLLLPRGQNPFKLVYSL